MAGCQAISDVLVSGEPGEHFVYSRNQNLSECLVGVIVLIDECGGGVESIAQFGYFSAIGVGWDDGYIAEVDRHDEVDGQ